MPIVEDMLMELADPKTSVDRLYEILAYAREINESYREEVDRQLPGEDRPEHSAGGGNNRQAKAHTKQRGSTKRKAAKARKRSGR